MDDDSAFTFWLCATAFIALVFGIATAAIAQRKGNSAWGGFWLGALLGPLGLLISLVRSADPRGLEESDLRSGLRKRCPDCAESVLDEARKCKHCGYLFDQPARAPRDTGMEPGAFDRAVHARRMFKP